jgi:cobalt-zinc-cadmium efflux system outer membrane protein
MCRRTLWAAAAAGVVAVLASTRGEAEEASLCVSRVTRASAVRCALNASLVVRHEREGGAVLTARKNAASPLLPSNPVVAFSAGRTTSFAAGSGTEPGALAWDASVAQEVEIGGQRGTRRAAIDAQLTGNGYRILQAQRDVAASAWLAYFEVLAAKEDTELSARLLAIGQAMATAARAKADAGLIAPIDGDVADAAAVTLTQAKLAADRRLALATFSLASLLGLGVPLASWSVEGDLAPVSTMESVMAPPRADFVNALPAIQMAEAERRAASLRADVYRRARIPNPTVSIFAQNYERAFGAGLSVPIPLPDPLGRTYSGEIAESEALARQAATRAEQLRRDAQLDLATAAETYRSRKQEAAAFTPERVRRAEESLKNIADEIQAGRLAVRDAVVAEQTLVGLLKQNLEARRAVCVASVALARAAGFPLEGGP